MARFVQAAGIEGTSTLEQRGATMIWTLTVVDGESKPNDWRGEDKAVDALADSFDGCRFVLAAGQFTSAVGFELSDDRRAATLRIPDDAPASEDAARSLRFVLAWVSAEK